MVNYDYIIYCLIVTFKIILLLIECLYAKTVSVTTQVTPCTEIPRQPRTPTTINTNTSPISTHNPGSNYALFSYLILSKLYCNYFFFVYVISLISQNVLHAPF